MRHAAALCVLGLLCAGTALAQDPPEETFRVITVPWVGTAPHVPHDAVNGEWHYFQAVARGCPGVIDFRWDFNGDGTYDQDWQRAPNRWNLGARHTLPAQVETRLFISRVQGRCGEEIVEDEFPIRVRVEPTREQWVNRLVDVGMWYTHTALNRDPNVLTAWWARDVDTAMVAQAMMNRGHRGGVDPEEDPYIEDVQWILHWLASRMTRRNIGAHGGVQPDLNGNGYGLRPAGNENYQTGPVLEALASYGDLEYRVPDHLGIAEVRGRRLQDVVQDSTEYHFWSQSDLAWDGNIVGGWTYSANGGVDTSQVGWTAVGLFAAEINAGVETPDWVKLRLFNCARYTDASRGGDQNHYGAYGYSSWNSHHPPNVSRAGAMLNSLGYALSRNPDNDRVRGTVNWIANHWVENRGGWDLHFNNSDQGNYYGIYQVSKGMRSYQPPFVRIGPNQLDWYAFYSDWLRRHQNANGSWNNGRGSGIGADLYLNTGIALLVLIPSVFEAPPVAVAEARPSQAGPGDRIRFDHSTSYSPDPGVTLIDYRWNFIDYPNGNDLNDDGDFDDEGESPPEDVDGDGVVTGDEIVWEVITDDPLLQPTFTYSPDIGFGEEETYRVTLQVTDRLDRTDIDDESVVIRISIINHPPVAVPHPSGDPNVEYRVVAGRRYTLDGSESYDPDSDDVPFPGSPPDRLTFWGWDLDSDGGFETEGQTAEFDVPAEWEIGQRRTINFTVCDDGQWTGDTDEACGGDCSLCAQRTAGLLVVENQPPVARTNDLDFIDEGSEVTIDAGPSSDPEGGVLTYEWTCDVDLPVSLSLDRSELRIDAREVDGIVMGTLFECALTVTDDLGQQDSLRFELRVINRPPVIDDVRLDVERIDEGGQVTITVEAHDEAPADDAILVYSVDCDGDGILDVLDRPSGRLVCPYPDDGVFEPVVVVSDDDAGQTVARAGRVVVDNVAPVMVAPPCPAALEGTPIAIQIIVTDPGDDPFQCALLPPVPDAALLGAETCVLNWTPTFEQAEAGRVVFEVEAADGDGAVARATIECAPRYLDEDMDGLPDTWEREHGLDPSTPDAEDDPDGDGLSNARERDLGTNPNEPDATTPPTLIDPIEDAIVDSETPDLRIGNSFDALDRELTYEFRIYADAELAVELAVSERVDEDPDETEWEVPEETLEEDQRYWWTARAHNGERFTPFAPAEPFVVDGKEAPPTAPVIRYPEDGDAVPALAVTIELDNSTDPDPGSVLRYTCEVARDARFENVVTRGEADEGEDGTMVPLADALEENARYHARCNAIDETGLAGPWSVAVSFTINTANDPPTAPSIIEPEHATVWPRLEVHLRAGNAIDPEGEALSYRFWLSTDPGFAGEQTWVSDEVEQGDGETAWTAPEALSDDTTYFWRVRARDAFVAGPHATARFRVDLGNRPPTVPTPLEPEADSVEERRVRYVWGASLDPDGDPVRYEVALYGEADAATALWTGESVRTLLDHPDPLMAGVDYWWAVRALDDRGGESEWSDRVPFSIAQAPDMAVPPDAALPDAALPEADAEPLPVDMEEADAEPGAEPQAFDVTGAGCTCDAGGSSPTVPLMMAGLLLGAVMRRRR